jgi:hypothetical protein
VGESESETESVRVRARATASARESKSGDESSQFDHESESKIGASESKSANVSENMSDRAIERQSDRAAERQSDKATKRQSDKATKRESESKSESTSESESNEDTSEDAANIGTRTSIATAFQNVLMHSHGGSDIFDSYTFFNDNIVPSQSRNFTMQVYNLTVGSLTAVKGQLYPPSLEAPSRVDIHIGFVESRTSPHFISLIPTSQQPVRLSKLSTGLYCGVVAVDGSSCAYEVDDAGMYPWGRMSATSTSTNPLDIKQRDWCRQLGVYEISRREFSIQNCCAVTAILRMLLATETIPSSPLAAPPLPLPTEFVSTTGAVAA